MNAATGNPRGSGMGNRQITEPNLWRASSRERVVTHPFDQEQSVDLAIVGGGFTGCAAALEAARNGASVCLLEAETIGHGGSGRNVGLVNAGLWLPPETVIAEMGEGPGKKLSGALSEGPGRVFALIAREGIDCEAINNGTLHLAHSEAGLKDLRERHRQGRALGVALELLDRETTARRTGTNRYFGALWDPRAGTIQPLSYCRGLARAAQAAGAHLYERSPVTALERQGDEWILRANGHQLRAKRLLIATNAYHLGIDGGFSPNFVAVSYCQFATAPMPAALREKVLPNGEGCWDTALVMSSFRTDQAGRLIVGGIGNSEGPGGRIHAAWARRKLRDLFPALRDLPFEHSWRGRIAMTSDHVPRIVEFGPSAYACFGYNGRGISPGTVFGTQAAKALLDAQPDHLPMAPVTQHVERFAKAREAYYEFGATLTHATNPSPL